jgi:hypothetical protein
MLPRLAPPLGCFIAIALVVVGGGAARVEQRDARAQPPVTSETTSRTRQALWDELRPVTLANCSFKRFGGGNDGGYVMCYNLLEVETGYSYGIGSNDDWGCEVSKTYGIPMHQYDCFSLPALTCARGRFVPHDECVGPTTETVEGRFFDTISNQIERNGDRGKRMVVKIDIEGAEWAALAATPDEVLERIDQLPMELHGVDDAQMLSVVRKLKRTFHLVHVHFNNHACDPALDPFPAKAYQVLFVNKRIGIVGTPKRGTPPPQTFDAPDNPHAPDCQLPSRSE